LLAAPLTAQKRHRYYEGSDSRRPHPGDGSLRLLRFAFSQANAVHRPSRHSDPNHAIRPMVALSVASAPSVIQGFAIIQQARHGFTPIQVRAPTDWQFASSCSPLRLSATQLPSATKSRLTLTGTFTLLTKRPHGRTGSRRAPGRLAEVTAPQEVDKSHIAIALPQAGKGAGRVVSRLRTFIINYFSRNRPDAIRFVSTTGQL
jgi:hypothetical protein